MDRLEEIKTALQTCIPQSALKEDVEYLISEIERLRTVEQAYQALLSATAGQKHGS